MKDPILGINVEDSHISAGLVNIETRKMLPNSVQRKRVDPFGSADQIIATWSKLLKDVAGETKVIGVSFPGICDYETGIYIRANADRYKSFYGSNLRDVFSSILGSTSDKVKLMNDGSTFLLGEVFGGAGRGFKTSLGITLGIGLGSSRYNNGAIDDAYLCDLPLYEGAPAEEYISIRWLLRRFNELTGLDVKDMSELRQYADTHHQFGQVFEEFATSISYLLDKTIRQNPPEVVVIGGFLELYNRYFFDSLTAKVAAMGIKTPILRAILGEQAAIIGAASLWYSDSPIHA